MSDIDEKIDLAIQLYEIVKKLVGSIQAQTGMSTEEIFAHAGKTLEENEKKLLEG